jgi:hypothetical protein
MNNYELKKPAECKFERALYDEKFQDELRIIFSEIDEYNSQRVAMAREQGLYIPKGQDGRDKAEKQRSFGPSIVVNDFYFEPKEYFRKGINGEPAGINDRVSEYEAFVISVGENNMPHAEHYVEIVHQTTRGSGIYVYMIPTRVMEAFDDNLDLIVSTLRKLKGDDLYLPFESTKGKNNVVGYEPAQKDIEKMATLLTVHGDYLEVYLPQHIKTQEIDVNGDPGEPFKDVRSRVGFELLPK